MSAYYYIGLDIHKKTISFCIKGIDGSLIGRRKISGMGNLGGKLTG